MTDPCPKCGAPMGEVEPSDTVWGGWVCPECGYIDTHPFTCLCGAGSKAERHATDCPCWDPADDQDDPYSDAEYDRDEFSEYQEEA